MKKLIVSLSVVLLGLISAAPKAAAQRTDARVDTARLVQEPGRQFRGDNDFRRDQDFARRGGRTSLEVDRLNLEVRELRGDIRKARRHIATGVRARFDRAQQATERLTVLYRSGRLPDREAWQRVREIRADISSIRNTLRARLIGIGDWR